MASLGCGGAIRFGQLDPPKGRYMVTNVSIDGADQVSESAILAGLATHSDNWSLADRKPLLDRASLPQDAKRIESIYAAHGHFGAKVDGFEVDQRADRTAHITFRVTEGPATIVRSLTLDGLEPAAGQDREAAARLEKVARRGRKLVPLRAGRTWTEARGDRGRDNLRRALREQGFVYAEVLPDVRVEVGEDRADVVYHVIPGPLARVAEVLIEGQHRIPEERIRRRVDLSAGEVPDRGALTDVELDVGDLGVFFAVSAEVRRQTLEEGLAGRPATPENVRAVAWAPDVTVVVTVQEMPAREVRAGVGLAIDNTRSEVHGRVGYQDRSFLGGLRFFDVDLQPAWVVVPSFAQPDTTGPGGSATLSFRQPSFLEEYLLLGLGTKYELLIEPGYRAHVVRGNVNLTRQFLHRITLTGGLNVEYSRFFNVSSALDLTQEQTFGLAFREQYVLTYFEESVVLDWRDSPVDARNGFFAQVVGNQASRSFGSEFGYLKQWVDLRGYLTPVRWMTLGLRLKGGITFNAFGSDTPLQGRFQGGGVAGNRGFGSWREGPYLCRTADGATTLRTTHERCDGERTFVGGNVMLLGSAEARFHLPANFGLVAFVDVGEIWAGRGDVDLSDLHVSVGPGLRYRTPFGPIRGDLAIRLTGSDGPAVLFHLSIGQAF